MLEEILKSGFEELGLSVDGCALLRYRKYYTLLEETNKHMNLTAISGEEDVARLHFLDSVSILSHVEMSAKTAIDVGTGAGFPGLALKIASLDISLTLLDSLDKRVNFLNTVCTELGLDDVRCVHARAEELGQDMRESFDFAVSRAVARLSLLSELCLPYVKPGGMFIAMKGSDNVQELKESENAIQLLGGELEKLIDCHIPGTDIIHSLVCIRKLKPTPEKYPRRWTQISKKPL